VRLFTLAGMMIASLAGALMSLAISLAPNAFAMSEIVTWLMGALTDRGWAEVRLAAPLTLVGHRAAAPRRTGARRADARASRRALARREPGAAAMAAYHRGPGLTVGAAWRWRGSSASSG
jgi:iron complex transport system permease protein